MTSKPLEPGDPLRLGRFEILARLGEGGQGVVYLGRGDEAGSSASSSTARRWPNGWPPGGRCPRVSCCASRWARPPR